MKKAIAAIFVIAISTAYAGSTYQFTLYKATTINGTALKPGPVKLDLQGDKVVIKQGKTSVESSVTVQNSNHKFDASSVTYSAGAADQVEEIRLGGTTTKLLFDSGVKTADATASGR
jgi:FlaG/FlaF family flagellin (archaellin)